jgi:zinc protease
MTNQITVKSGGQGRQPSVLLILALIALLFAVPLFANQNIPLDPKVVRGRLDNGLSYYVRPNAKPEKRAELRLVVHAGSIEEDEDQKGLAHFLEHMAFNGTENFKKQEMVEYLESIGMKFGADVNAYTSFDETVYTLTIPTDKPEIVTRAFDILEDWAHRVTMQQEEIDKERPVVIEEWRTGRGASARIRDQQWPVLLKGSKYADHMPIGKKEVIESFPRKVLQRFYRDWYRPDLMAIVAVGDFDPSNIEQLVKQHFSNLKNPRKERKRQDYPVPPHKETRYSIVSDPEMPLSVAQIYYKSERRPDITEADARRELAESLFFGMLNQRLLERTNDADPPYLFSAVKKESFIDKTEALVLMTGTKENGLQHGMQAMLEEKRRAEVYGFTAAELERSKTNVLRSLERAYAERDKTESGFFASQLVEFYLDQDPAPDMGWQLEFARKAIPGISLEEINRMAAQQLSGQNGVVMVSFPKKEGVTAPTEAEISSLIEASKTMQVKAYEENIPKEPLIKEMPKPATITDQTTLPDVGITEWRLSNGVRILLKPTDFKSDQILFKAWSAGGASLVPDADAVSANFAADLADESGLGAFDQFQLSKILAGKVVSASPYISDYYEGVSGSAAPKDFETALQLVYLTFTSPRLDEKTYTSTIAKLNAFLQNRDVQPEAKFQEEFSKLLTQNHFRTRPPSIELLKELNRERAFAIYKDRFADASGFTFAFVGNFEPDAIKPLILTYIGGLPSVKRNEAWKDLKISPPDGVVKKEYKLGQEPKSAVRIVFHGPFEWKIENRLKLYALGELLNIKLRESLREDLGGVYGVGVSGVPTPAPANQYQLIIRFGCAPGRVEELIAATMQTMKTIQNAPPAESDTAKVRESLLRQHEVSLKQNEYWLGVIEIAYQTGEPISYLSQFEKLVNQLTPQTLQQAAQHFISFDNYVQAVMMPK